MPELTGRIVFEPEYRDPQRPGGAGRLQPFVADLAVQHGGGGICRGQKLAAHGAPAPAGRQCAAGGVCHPQPPTGPNALGLSCVELVGVDGGDLLVKGADLLDGTPIFDIKPYLPYVDAHPDARGGFTEQTAGYGLTVECAPELLAKVPKEKQAALLGVLQKRPPAGVSARPPAGVYAGLWRQ